MGSTKKILIIGAALTVIGLAYLTLRKDVADDESTPDDAKSVSDVPLKSQDSDKGDQNQASVDAAQAITTEAAKPAQVPSQVLTKDLKIGRSKIVTPGTTVSFHIMAKLEDGKIVFDSAKENRPWTGTVGAGAILPGIDRGIRGMMTGGKRALWISPDLAYGDNGITGQIPPNAKIYAEIDLLAVY